MTLPQRPKDSSKKRSFSTATPAEGIRQETFKYFQVPTTTNLPTLPQQQHLFRLASDTLYSAENTGNATNRLHGNYL